MPKPRISIPRILIVSPALANANNGNWQTAWRWSRMLRHEFQVDIAQEWDGSAFDVMLALHARRSADSIGRWAESKGSAANVPGLGVVLTGTHSFFYYKLITKINIWFFH